MRMGALAFVMREAQGRLDELEAGVRHFADTQPAMPVWRCGLLCVYLQSVATPQLRRAYERLLGESTRFRATTSGCRPSRCSREACAHLGHRSSARMLRAGCSSPTPGASPSRPDVAFLGPVDRYLALLAATEGDDDAGRAPGSQSARDLAERMGAQPTLARLALDEATWLPLDRDRRAADLVAEAIARAEGLAARSGWRRGLARSGPPAPETACAMRC